ncbi:MAG: hypothetical protein E7Z86_08140 [Methanosphaera stadtmanae]|nr:hypothetical protein [Methanosphaera stadtmanae]
MSKDNCIIRNDFIAQVYTSNDIQFLETYTILETDYDYIIESMQEEEFILENPYCNIFKELLYEDKVVGFVTYDLQNGVGDFSLNAAYILPKYRGNGIFFYELENVLINGNTLSIYNPNHKIMEKLIEYDFARYLDSNLVASSISLDIPTDKLLSNDNKLEVEDDLLHASNLYDIHMCMVIILIDISTPNKNIIYYSKLQDTDKEKSEKNREHLDATYFQYIKDTILDNHEQFVEILTELTEKLPRAEYTLEEIVGTAPELSIYLQEIINEGLITKEKAYEVQKQLTEEFETKEVLPESLMKRLMYLVLEDDMEAEDFDDTDAFLCPYCGYPTSLSARTCNTCGYNIHDLNPMDMIKDLEDFNQQIESMVEQMKAAGMSDEMIESILSDAFKEIEDDLIDLDNELSQLIEEDESFIKAIILTLKNLKTQSTIQEACAGWISQMNIDSDELYDYLVTEGLVDIIVTNESFREFYGLKLKVNQLKDILRENNQKISGNKKELIDRIADNLNVSQIPLDITSSYGIKDTLITNKQGLKFIEQYKYILEE